MSAEDTRPTATTDHATRDMCRAAILTYLRGLGKQENEMRSIAAIYHGHYSMSRRAPRWPLISYFLKKMEDDGLVACAYDREGRVISVKAK